MEERSSKATSSSDTRYTPGVLCNQKVLYSVHKRLLLVYILAKLIHTRSSHWISL